MFRRSQSFGAIRRLMHDSSQVRAMSLVHPFALHNGEGSASGGAGGSGDGGDGGKGGDAGKGGKGGDGGDDGDMPIEQQLGAVKGKNRELLGKLAANKPLVEFARTLGISDVTKLAPAKLEKLKAALADDESNDGKPDAKQDARIRALQEGHQQEVATLKGRETVLTTALDRALRRSAASDAISAEGGNAKLLAPVVDQHVKLIEDPEKPGEFAVVVVDDKGNVRYGKGGKELTPRDFVAELKASGDFDGAFKAPASNGGGSSNGNAGKGGAAQGSELVISREDAQDSTKYRAARARAEKEGLTLKIGA